MAEDQKETKTQKGEETTTTRTEVVAPRLVFLPGIVGGMTTQEMAYVKRFGWEVYR